MLPKTHEDDVDNTGALFSVELNDRQYMLKVCCVVSCQFLRWGSYISVAKASCSHAMQSEIVRAYAG